MKVRKLIIKGFKKFVDFSLEFNEEKSVIVGENESGKTTILDAIDLVLNQSIFRNQDSSMIKYLNLEQVNHFFSNPSIETLPKISIEMYIDNLGKSNGVYFSGLHYESSDGEPKEGIKFVYELDSDFLTLLDLNDFASKKNLPIEFYKASWTTFQEKAFKRQMLDLNYIFLDNSSSKNDLYGSYARKLFVAKIEEKNRRELSCSFNGKLKEFLGENSAILKIDESKKIGIDVSKSSITNLVDIYENDISLKSMGKGRENIIKTEMALNNRAFDLVLIEEPENHLSHSNIKKLINVIDSATNEQLIITSHNSLVVGRLDLENVIWISENRAYKLDQLDEDTSVYFSKVDNIDILKFILSEKVVLVEGASEYITFSKMFKKVTNKNIDESGVEVISMGSVSYLRYKDIANQLKKKVAVIFDNDKNPENIKNMFKEEYFRSFCSDDLGEWTFEVSLYNNNTTFFDTLYKDKKTESEFKGEKVSKALAHMLKNKTDNAIIVENKISEINIPSYIQEAIKWISE